MDADDDDEEEVVDDELDDDYVHDEVDEVIDEGAEVTHSHGMGEGFEWTGPADSLEPSAPRPAWGSHCMHILYAIIVRIHCM